MTKLTDEDKRERLKSRKRLLKETTLTPFFYSMLILKAVFIGTVVELFFWLGTSKLNVINGYYHLTVFLVTTAIFIFVQHIKTSRQIAKDVKNWCNMDDYDM